MTEMAQTRRMRHPRPLHPLPVRIMHWLNAAAILIMIGSGWKIYNDNVLFGWLRFSDSITIGGEAQGALQWHFFAMWILVLNGLCYVTYGALTGRFGRMLIPIWPREVIRNIRDALHFRLNHDDLTRYNGVQKLLYAGILVVSFVQVLTGLAIWKPVQFGELVDLFFDFQGARLAHFLGMSAIVLFLLVHITLALIVPRTLINMITGGPQVIQSPTSPLPATANHAPAEALQTRESS